MNARFHVFAQAFSRPQAWARPGRASSRPFVAQFVFRGSTSKFSTSSLLRQIAQGAKKAVQDAAKRGSKAADPSQQYPARLVIYNAGDIRSSFVAFWKATALFQFGIVAVFLAPILLHNTNEPDPNMRLLHAVGITVAGAIPTILMAYLTTPFVKRVALELPKYARQSRQHLTHFCNHMPAETKLEFTTLRAFPFERNTAVFLFELKSLPAQRFRFANLERAKTAEWVKRQKTKSVWSRITEVVNEPRFKFYVKEGRNYTVKTGVPGVWESVAKAVKMQTEKAAADVQKAAGKPVQVRKPLVLESAEKPARLLMKLKRQTSRSSKSG